MKKTKKTRSQVDTGFLAFLNNEANHQRQNGHISLSNNYRSASNSFSRFLSTRNMQDVSFEDYTSRLISDYEAWLQVEGLCKNTTSFYIRVLQAVYNKAVRQGLTTNQNPFVCVYRGVAKTVKRAIEPHKVNQLKALNIRLSLEERNLSGKKLDNMQRQLEFARDIFLFCFCARGLTFVDLAHMKKSNIEGDILTYVRRKTKQRIEVQLEPLMQEIIERHPSKTEYLLPILSKTENKETVFQQYKYALSQYNTHLHMLSEMLGSVKLTSYVSRHSWATAARQLHIPLSVISQSMGHDSEKTTEIYLKSLESNVINKANHELISNVFGMVTGGVK